MSKQKLYCYVDETGQDTKGKIFLVSVIVLEKERDRLRQKLRDIEKASGKYKKKWTKTKKEQRKKYIEQIINNKELKKCIYYSYYENSLAYLDLTIFSTAKAVNDKAKSNYEAIVLVDGLKRGQRLSFGAGLRRLKIRVRKVRGIRDEADEFIRLADAIAGFVRIGLESSKGLQDLYKRAETTHFIKRI